ncbi:MAG: hypothetical protein OXC55_02815 [Chloroflexi bacterium]|nr:hypothetical protein [Chloroflexota bacterium]
MTGQPVTLKVIRDAEASELSELSALALIWGLAKAITETPSDALDLFLDELPGDLQPDRRA